MSSEQPARRVQVEFIGRPPVARIERASGVSEVDVRGRVVRCLVHGSFQPFLEALHGSEVTTLQSAAVAGPASPDRVEGGL
jgi:hypothetical protein